MGTANPSHAVSNTVRDSIPFCITFLVSVSLHPRLCAANGAVPVRFGYGSHVISSRAGSGVRGNGVDSIGLFRRSRAVSSSPRLAHLTVLGIQTGKE